MSCKLLKLPTTKIGKFVVSSCHREQCRDPQAVICFTLMDYDVITANDFGGEAFLPLHSVPGVEIGSSSIENFHGLKPFILPLMFQKNKSENLEIKFKKKKKYVNFMHFSYFLEQEL